MFKISFNLVFPWGIEGRSEFHTCSVKAVYFSHSVILKVRLHVEQEDGSRNCIFGILKRAARSEEVLELQEAL